MSYVIVIINLQVQVRTPLMESNVQVLKASLAQRSPCIINEVSQTYEMLSTAVSVLVKYWDGRAIEIFTSRSR